MNTKQLLQQTIKEFLSTKGITESIYLDIPSDHRFGDYTSNIALICAARLGVKPRDLAQEIAYLMEKEHNDLVENVNIEGPGFINIILNNKTILSNIQTLANCKLDFAKSPGKEMIENTQPNANKPLHIGHLRNTALGVSLVNLRRAIGKDALSVNINNDRGIHIIKAMWGYLNFGKLNITTKEQVLNIPLGQDATSWQVLLSEWVKDFRNNEWSQKWQVPEKANIKSDHLLGWYYILGERAENNNKDSVGQQMKDMLRAWEGNNEDVRLFWRELTKWFYEGFIQTHARFLGISVRNQQFDKEWYESDIYQEGKDLVESYLDKGLFHKREDGAIIADLKKYRLPEKVVIRSDGSSLYITQDLALVKKRILEDKPDLLAYVVADEQELYFKQLFAICEGLDMVSREKLRHISYGMVNLSGGVKMSSREGTVITADELINIVSEKIKKSFSMQNDQLIDSIAIGAIKYEMLKHNPKTSFEFNIDTSISLEGNSGPYLQYTYARSHSLIQKTQHRENNDSDSMQEWAPNNEEKDLMRVLLHYQEVVEKASTTWSPNILCDYLYIIAKEYNAFYQKHRILDAQKEQERTSRLLLTKAVKFVLAHGLGLLGIAVPESL